MLHATLNTGKMPRPGELQEIHVNGDEVRNIGIVPVRKFCFEWAAPLGNQVDSVDIRVAYLGIVHSGGATLIALPDQSQAISREIDAARAHYETAVSHV